jgi:hypothetical protein
VSISGGEGATNFISGSFVSQLGAIAPRSNRGRIVVRYAARSSVTLAPVSARASAEGAPTRLVFRVAVVGAESLAECRRGATGTLSVLDSGVLDRRARTADRVVVSLPRACGGSRAYADASAGGRTTAKVAFH